MKKIIGCARSARQYSQGRLWSEKLEIEYTSFEPANVVDKEKVLSEAFEHSDEA